MCFGLLDHHVTVTKILKNIRSCTSAFFLPLLITFYRLPKFSQKYKEAMKDKHLLMSPSKRLQSSNMIKDTGNPKDRSLLDEEHTARPSCCEVYVGSIDVISEEFWVLTGEQFLLLFLDLILLIPFLIICVTIYRARALKDVRLFS